MTTPVVTVLITTYNYGEFIEEAIDSILSQDYPLDKIQILVVDDGSTDDTWERIKRYGSRIDYFQKPNGGQASALNFGFAKARGEIVTLLDADDMFVSSKLTRVTQAFQRDPALGMVYHRALMWKAATDEYRAYHNFLAVSGDLHQDPDRFVSYIPQPTTCVCFRRISVNALLPIPESIRMNADCFLVALIPFLAPVLALSEFLSLYRIHGKNSFFVDEPQIPRSLREYRLLTWQTVVDEMRKWLADNGFTRKQLPVRTFLDRWTAFLDLQRLRLSPRSRLRYFRFVVLENRLSSPLQTWKLTAFNYLCSPLALVFGYQRAPQFYEWRGRLMKAVQSFLTGHSAKASKPL
jgi:glycosyltransferase involved in cell wall biosynthesis